jgi:hypothetical protein
MPYGYHLSAPLSAITVGFPLSAPLSVYRFQDHSPGATPFGYHLSAPLSAIAFSTAVGLPFGPAFSLPLSDHNFLTFDFWSSFKIQRRPTSQLFLRLSLFGPAFGVPTLTFHKTSLKPVGASPLPEKAWRND